MTQPDEAVDQKQEATQEQVPEKLKDYLQANPRERIYRKYDEMVKQEMAQEEKPPEQPPAEVEKPEEVVPEQTAETTPEAASASQPEGEDEEVLTREEYEKRFAKIRVKGKFAGEDAVIPASELVKNYGLEKHYQKRLTEVNLREKELLEKQFQVQDPLMAAAFPQPPPMVPTQPAPMNTALEHLSDEQVRSRYNELALESPFDATRFLDLVRDARQNATVRFQKNRAELAEKAFLGTYGLSKESPEWQKINDRGFYEKYPDILRARDRGDYDSMFATAFLHLQREQLENERKQLEERLKMDKAKNEDKKKGQVLRAASKPEPVKPKEDKPESPEEYIRRLREQRRGLQGIAFPKR